MVDIRALSIDDALREFREAAQNAEYADVDSIVFGDWVSKNVHIPKGLDSEITSPFLDAYAELQDDLYRLVALIAYGSADIRLLSQEDLDVFLLKVKVTGGSSNYLDNVP